MMEAEDAIAPAVEVVVPEREEREKGKDRVLRQREGKMIRG